MQEVELDCLNPKCRHRDPEHPDRPARFTWMRLTASGQPLVSDPTRCPSCAHEEQERESAFDRRVQEEADAARRTEKEVSLLELVEQAGGNPWEYGRHTLEDFEAWDGRELALEASRKFAADVLGRSDRYERIRSLMLWGPTGVAKTELAHGVLKALLAGGAKPRSGVLFDDFGQLVSEVQSAYHGGENVWPLLQRRISADVWILDDLFSDKVTDDSVRIALQIVNGRQGKPMMITMNPDPSHVEVLYPDLGDNLVRLLSRLSRFRAVPVQGADARPEVR